MFTKVVMHLSTLWGGGWLYAGCKYPRWRGRAVLEVMGVTAREE